MGGRRLPGIETGDDSSRVCFLHSVGKLTVCQGLAVPVSVQASWVKEIRKGEAIPVTICFGESQSVAATLRRINNAVGHLQLRHEGRKQSALRDYLESEFIEGPKEGAGPLEVIEVNSRIAESLLERGWQKEVRVLKEIGLRVDFERNGTWLEVEFGNARGYYQDYIKFALADRYRSAACGILLCPTEPFAHLLCELGRKQVQDRPNPGGPDLG